MNRKTTLLLVSLFILFIFGIMGCGEGQSGDSGGEISGSSATSSAEVGSSSGGSTEIGNPVVAGLIQKGPFYTGTQVIVKELDDVSLLPTGVEHTTEVANDLGAFTFDNTTDISSPYVEISATGHYFNEVAAIDSTQPLTLCAFVDITKTKTVNINILTTIAAKREKYLITQDGKTYEEAKIQAQKEVLMAFKFAEGTTDTPIVEGIDTFANMDIGQDGTKNAVLLSLSILFENFQNINDSASVSQALDSISTDIEADGVCDNSENIHMLFYGADEIDLPQVRENLETYFRPLARWFIIPDFESIFKNNIIPQIPLMAPIFSTPSGTYNKDISVSLFSSMPGTLIFYSINNGDPVVYRKPIVISGNGTVMNIKAWTNIFFMLKSYVVSSYYLIDYDYDDDLSKYKRDMTIDDYRSNIAGTWIGYIEPPLQLLSPDNVKVTFDETGQYKAEQLSFFLDSKFWIFQIVQGLLYEQLGSNFCYGTEFDYGTKTIDINEMTANGKAMADLILHNVHDDTRGAGKFEEICMSDDFNHMQYKFRCNGLPYQTFTFNLTRLP